MLTDNQVKNLISSLNNLQQQINNAQGRVNYIQNHQASYNYTVRVPYTHKKKVSWGFVKTGWVWKEETRYKNEIRFNQQRYNNDLANANNNKQQQQNQFNNVKTKIENHLTSMRSLINKNNLDAQNLQKQIVNLEKEIKQIEAQITVSVSNNLLNDVTQHNNKLIELNKKSKKIADGIKHIQVQNQNLKQSISKKLQQKDQLVKQESGINGELKVLYTKITEKLAKMSVMERAGLVYIALDKDKQDILKILKKFDYSKEEVIKHAVVNKNQKIFDYFLDSVKFDTLLDKSSTLALKIMKHVEKNSDCKLFLNKMFKAGQSLDISFYLAVKNNNFKSIDILLGYNKLALQDFIKTTGVSIIQYAIAADSHKLLEYIASKDSECLKQKVKGYNNFLELVLSSKNSKIIKILTSNIDLDNQMKKLIDQGKHKLIKKAVTHIKFSDKKLYEMLKYSDSKAEYEISDLLIQGIYDVQKIFAKMILDNHFKLASELMKNYPDEISESFVRDLAKKLSTDGVDIKKLSVFSLVLDETENSDAQNLGESDDNNTEYDL